MKILTKKAIEGVSEMSGLTPKIVRHLLNAGWTFSTSIDKPLTWTRDSHLDNQFYNNQGEN